MAQNLTSGVVLHGGALEWTTVRPAKNRLEVAERRSLPAAAGDFAAPELAGAVKTACDHAKGELCVAIPSGKVLLRVVDLPTADLAEMKNMAELQVDKFSPFPLEHMAVSSELLSQKETSSRVLIGAVQREVVDALGAAFGKAGRLPRWVDVEVLGWWHLLKEGNEVPAEGRRVILLLDTAGTELIISQDGVPVVFRSLGLPQGISEEEFHTELAEDIAYTLTTLEAERGSAESPVLSLWFWSKEGPPKTATGEGEAAPPGADDAPAGLIEKLREASGLEVQTRRLDALPPLSEGIAARALLRLGLGGAAARGTAVLDLAPAEWRAESQSQRGRKSLLVATFVFLGLWLAASGAFVGGLKLEQARLAATKAGLVKLKGPADEVQQFKDKIADFERFADRTHSGLEALREVTLLMPQGVELGSFSYKKAESVTVRGTCASPEPIYDFLQALERSAFFKGTKAEGVRSKQEGGVTKSEFAVTAYLREPKKEVEAP